MYNSLIYKSSENHGENVSEDYEDSYYSPCSASYKSRSGVNGYTRYSRGFSMELKTCTSPKPRDITSQASYSSGKMYESGNQGRNRGYSRCHCLPTLSIFKVEWDPKVYLDWEWQCERVFEDYVMSGAKQVTYALKYIQGPTLV